jgi:light-regulated signal transduction histidine kinase (bacteriophytochrome)
VPLIHGGNTIGMVGLGNRGGYGPRSGSRRACAGDRPGIVEQVGTIVGTHQQRIARLYGTAQTQQRCLARFAFIASHDLQEPLRKIQAFGDLLKSHYSSRLDERGQDYIERMQGAAGRMQSMLKGLLDYSRVTIQGKPFAKIDLHQIAIEVLSDLEVRMAKTGAQVELGDLPEIEADPMQMRQLLQNLIGNAIKYHRPEVPPVVSVYTGSPVSPEFVQIVVQDNGIGFEMSCLDQLFKPFHRLHGKSAYEGSGMGLAICRKIVERHEGSITARSVPGEGSNFLVTLRRTHVAAQYP